MACIVCATRGGEGSRAVQMEAIRRSKELGEPLVFLFVTDPDSLGPVDDNLKEALYGELNWMGHTLLRIAQKRAELAGLKTEVVIRQGNVREEIGRFLNESQACSLLLGAPRGITHHIMGDDAIEKFAMAIQAETGVPVEVIRPELLE